MMRISAMILTCSLISGLANALSKDDVTSVSKRQEYHNGIAYFLFETPSDSFVKRYDMEQEIELEPFSLDEIAVGFEVADEGVYYSFENTVYRRDHDGSNRIFVRTIPNYAHDMIATNNVLILNIDRTLLAIDRVTHEFRDQISDPLTGFLTASEERRMLLSLDFGEIQFLKINPDGTFGESGSAPYPVEGRTNPVNASRVFIFPNGNWMLGGNGLVIDIDTFGYVGTVGTQVTDARFLDNDVVLTFGPLSRVDENFKLIETIPDADSGNEFFIHNRTMFLFDLDLKGNIHVRSFTEEEFGPIGDLPTRRSTDRTYTMFDSQIAINGVLYIAGLYAIVESPFSLVQVNHLNALTGSYLPPMPIFYIPKFFEFTDSQDLLVLSYERGGIFTLDLTSSEVTLYEHRFNVPTLLYDVDPFDGKLLVVRDKGPDVVHVEVYSMDGELLDRPLGDGINRSEFIWRPDVRRMYSAGRVGGQTNISSYTVDAGGTFASVATMAHDQGPFDEQFFVSEDGREIVSSAGRVFDGETLEQESELGIEIEGAIWLDGLLYTVNEEITTIGMNSTKFALRRWHSNGVRGTYDQEAFRVEDGVDPRLHTVEEKLVVAGLTPPSFFPFVKIYNPALEDASFLIDTEICDAFEPAFNQLDAFEAIFHQYDVYAPDLEGLPFIASLALLEEITCNYGPERPILSELVEAAFHANVDAFIEESPENGLSFYRHFVTVAMMIGSTAQTVIRSEFAEEDIELLGEYSIVTDVGRAGRFGNEPFSGLGDLDDDGFTNAEEWLEVITAGGSLEEFVLQATPQPPPGPASPPGPGGGGRSRCLIATVAHGTPLADELDTIRAWRDEHMMDNAVGGFAASMYYRLSPATVVYFNGNETESTIPDTAMNILKFGLSLFIVGFVCALTLKYLRFENEPGIDPRESRPCEK
jgi:hypothetical protein